MRYLCLFITWMLLCGPCLAEERTMLPDEVIAAGLGDNEVVFAVVEPHDLNGESLKGTIFDLPVSSDKSHDFLQFDLGLYLVRPITVLGGRSLPQVIHIVGTRFGVSIRSNESELDQVELTPVLSEPGKQWLVMLKPVLPGSSLVAGQAEVQKHLGYFQEKGIQFYALINAGKGAYEISQGAVADEEFRPILPEALIGDLRTLKDKQSVAINGVPAEKAALSQSLGTELGRDITLRLGSGTASVPPPDLKPKSAVADETKNAATSIDCQAMWCSSNEHVAELILVPPSY